MNRHAQLSTTLESRYAIRLRTEYLTSLIAGKKIAGNGNDERQIFELFLNSDISETSVPVIPDNFAQFHEVMFPSFSSGVIFQIIDIIDIENSAQSLLNTITASTPVRQVYHQLPTEPTGPVNFPRGTLRLDVTDGYRAIAALELKNIPGLSMNTCLGAKILVKNCRIHRGTLMLKPENCQVLGGDVPSLYDGDLRKNLTRRLRTRLGLSASADIEDEQEDQETDKVASRPASTTTTAITPIVTQPKQEYDDMDSILQGALLDDSMDTSELAMEDTAVEYGQSLAQQAGYLMYEHRVQLPIEPLDNNNEHSNVINDDYSDFEFEGSDHNANATDSASHVADGGDNVPAAATEDSPILSQDFGYLDLMDDDEELIVVKEEKIKQEGTIQTSVSQLKRIVDSINQMQPEWQHVKKVVVETKITNLASMKAQKGTGKLISTIGILKSEQRKGSDYEVQIYIGADILDKILAGATFNTVQASHSKGETAPHWKQVMYMRDKLLQRIARIELDVEHMHELSAKNNNAKIPRILNITLR